MLRQKAGAWAASGIGMIPSAGRLPGGGELQLEHHVHPRFLEPRHVRLISLR